MIEARKQTLIACIIVLGTVLGLAGTDLVLPAIPSLPSSIDGTLTQAQLVLAAFTAGIAAGLLVFGELGARFSQRHLLIFALLGYGLFSAAAAFSHSIMELVVWRVGQGFVASAPAVFAPGMIRSLFDERRALRAMGVMGSIESVVPALAPIAGAWLLGYFDWRASFIITAILAVCLALTWAVAPAFTGLTVRQSKQGYLPLLKKTVFLRYALSQAGTLGGLLIFVFGAPTVMIIGMNGSLADFITMQIIGISLFILAANTAHLVVDRFGREQTIMGGSALAAAASAAILVYALIADTHEPGWIWVLFSLVNLGLGFRGPPGFYMAIVASGDNDARGAAIVMLLIFVTTAAGTAALAPFITLGLVPLAAVAFLVSASGVAALALLPPLPPNEARP